MIVSFVALFLLFCSFFDRFLIFCYYHKIMGFPYMIFEYKTNLKDSMDPQNTTCYFPQTKKLMFEWVSQILKHYIWILER